MIWAINENILQQGMWAVTVFYMLRYVKWIKIKISSRKL